MFKSMSERTNYRDIYNLEIIEVLEVLLLMFYCSQKCLRIYRHESLFVFS